jgi:hypothetical protein
MRSFCGHTDVSSTSESRDNVPPKAEEKEKEADSKEEEEEEEEERYGDTESS